MNDNQQRIETVMKVIATISSGVVYEDEQWRIAMTNGHGYEEKGVEDRRIP